MTNDILRELIIVSIICRCDSSYVIDWEVAMTRQSEPRNTPLEIRFLSCSRAYFVDTRGETNNPTDLIHSLGCI